MIMIMIMLDFPSLLTWTIGVNWGLASWPGFGASWRRLVVSWHSLGKKVFFWTREMIVVHALQKERSQTVERWRRCSVTI